PPTGVEPNTQGLSLGYQVSAGVDLRFGSVEGTALRIHGSLWSVTSTLAGVSSFQLAGFRLALGMSYRDTYRGNVAKLTTKQAEAIGFNDSSVHTDIISTTRRTVTAHLKDGSKKVIYKDGRFVL
ncbi:MAG: Thermophilic metalloprotease (M29) superfamily, partial [Candidatus Kaiserbacteria bacterium GW2011_GWB1_52_6]